MKTKHTPKIDTAITRPAATVTITINGQQHKLTEAEANELHAKLTKTLGIEPEKVFLRKPARWPEIPVIPKYVDPPVDPFNRPYRIICDINGG